jgi:transcriptional regulator with XRE-family HTH domain
VYQKFYVARQGGEGTMSAKEFGDLVDHRMAELEISQRRLAMRLGELSDGRIFEATQIRLIREGRRRLDHELVQRLIDVLDMDALGACLLSRVGLIGAAGTAATSTSSHSSSRSPHEGPRALRNHRGSHRYNRPADPG